MEAQPQASINFCSLLPLIIYTHSASAGIPGRRVSPIITHVCTIQGYTIEDIMKCIQNEHRTDRLLGHYGLE